MLLEEYDYLPASSVNTLPERAIGSMSLENKRTRRVMNEGKVAKESAFALFRSKPLMPVKKLSWSSKDLLEVSNEFLGSFCQGSTSPRS